MTFYDGSNATQLNQTATNLTVYTTGGGIKIGSGFNDNIVCSSNIYSSNSCWLVKPKTHLPWNGNRLGLKLIVTKRKVELSAFREMMISSYKSHL